MYFVTNNRQFIQKIQFKIANFRYIFAPFSGSDQIEKLSGKISDP